jgi:hypothetical protein
MTLLIEGLALTKQSLICVHLMCLLLPWPFPLGFCRLTMQYVILSSQFSLIKIKILLFCLPQSYLHCRRPFYPLNSHNTVCHLVMPILINILLSRSQTHLSAELCVLWEAIYPLHLIVECYHMYIISFCQLSVIHRVMCAAGGPFIN